MGNAFGNKKYDALTLVPECNTSKFMGTWFVIHVKPTIFEVGASHAVEKYSEKSPGRIDIDFQYRSGGKDKSLPQKGWVQPRHNGALWKVSPLWPIKMPYSIIGLASDYSHCVIGYPNRAYFWVMARNPIMDESTYQQILRDLKEKHGYDLEGSFKVNQDWSDREYALKRGLVEETESHSSSASQ
mmetsp:Transcript_28308/g.53587  ORF Transcript_28308/g.53587 Transcript_28308/m.53587 type:complete len:185 (-) Transcript_28308:22-576(-)